MNQKKLFEILEIVGKVNSTTFNIKNDVFNAIVADVANIFDKNWNDSIYSYKELDLKNWDNWSTYDKCYDISFDNIKNKLYCYITIYNGNMTDGYRISKRFSATVILPNKFILKLKDCIKYALDWHLSQQYEEHLENQRKLWMLNMKNEILKK